MSIDPIIRKWANVFLKLDRMVEGSPNTKTASNKIMRALEASTPDARSVAGWYSAYRAGRSSLREAATALYREGAALPSRRTGSREVNIPGVHILDRAVVHDRAEVSVKRWCQVEL